VNVTHWEMDTLSSPPDFTSAAGDLANHFLTTYSAVLSTLDHWDDVTVTAEQYTGAPIGQGIHLVGVDGARSITSPVFAPQLCCLISRRTGTPRRWGRGRLFCPPAYDSSAAYGGGTWNPNQAYMISCGTLASTLQTGFSAGSTSYIPIIWSRSRALTNQTPYFAVVTQCTANTAQHWLRSRGTAP